MAAYAFPSGCKREPSVRNIGRLWIHVALQTQESAFAPQQQHSINRSVRRVARRAAFSLYRRVLENVWSTLLRMAFDAGFPVRIAQHDLIPRAVGIVAVRTFHESLWNAMMRRKGELRFDRLVALVAQVRL